MDELIQDTELNLALWILSSSARLSSASSRQDVLDQTAAAFRELGLPTAKVWCGPEPAPEYDSQGVIVSAGHDDADRVHAAFGIDEDLLGFTVHGAIDELLTFASAMLRRYSGDDAQGPTQHIDEALHELSSLLAHADDRSTLLHGVLNIAVETFQPFAAAIVRDDPLYVLHTHNNQALDLHAGPDGSMRGVAEALLPDLLESERAVMQQRVSGQNGNDITAWCLQLSRAESGALALVLCYRVDQPMPVNAPSDALARFSHVLTQSQKFQSITSDHYSNQNHLRALNEATLAASSTHDLHQLYDAIRAALVTVMPTDAMLIAITPEGSDKAICVYRNEGDQSYFDHAPLSQPFQVAMQLGRPFMVEEIPEHLTGPDGQYRFGDQTRRVKSLAGAPLIANNRTTGLIVAQSYQIAAYRVEHADLLLDIGRSIAVALERAQLVDRLRTRSLHEAAMRNLTQKLATTLDVPTLLDLVVAEVAAVLEDTLVVAAHVESLVIPARRTVASEGPDSLRRELGVSNDGVITPNGIVDQLIGSCESQSTVADGRALFVVPLQDEGGCIGTLIFARHSRIPFTADEQSTFAILEGIVGSALRNALLYRARASDESDLLEVERISRLVASSLETGTILSEILASLPALFQSEGCSVRIVDGNHLVPLAVHGEIVHSFADRVPIDTSLAGTIVRDKRMLAVEDLHSHPAAGRHARRTGVKVRGWLACPMIDSRGDVFGILSIHSDYPRHWTERDKVLLQTLAESTTVAIQNAWRFSRTRDTLLASVESLANAVDAKDPTTLNHSRNVSAYARRVAEAMGLSHHDVDNIALAGLLHDIGKIGIPDRILQKPDVLNVTEWERMKTHPVIGEQILSGHLHLKPVLPLIRHHHERWDGMGYPDRLAGSEIPLGAAIVALADAVDTMASERPYRKALSWDFVRQVVQEETGKQFHPEVATTLLSLLDNGEIQTLGDKRDARIPLRAGVRDSGMSLDARGLMIFHGVAREIRALTNLETFIANVTDVIRDVMETANIQIFLVDDNAQEFYYRPTEGDRLRGFREARRRIGSGVVGWVIQHGTPLLVPDVSADDRFIFASVSDVRSEVAVPLIVDDAVIGAINAESSIVAAFSDADVRLLTATAAHLAQTIQVARLHDQFKQLATTDALTGLANHRAFYDRLDEEIRHASITGGLLTVAIMDVDKLKYINDTYGHLAGDEMLRALASVLRERCRRSDHVARYGGDEFAFILTDTDLRGAERAIAHLIEGLAQRTIFIDGEEIPLSTGAWGISSYPEDGVRPAELVRVADQRMYSNKTFARAFQQDADLATGFGRTTVQDSSEKSGPASIPRRVDIA